jgi:hypothetical protein
MNSDLTALRGVFEENSFPMEQYLGLEMMSASWCVDLVTHGKWGFYRRNLDPKRERKETKALSDGTLLHTLILEPKRFAEEYLCGPEGKTDKRLKIWKDAVKEAEEAGKQIIDHETWLRLMAAGEAIDKHPYARGALKGPGKSELTVLWDENGIPARARFDRISPKVAFDLKKTRDASDAGFPWEAKRYRYDIKAEWYLRAARAFPEQLGQGHFGFVAVELEYPHLCNVFVYEPDDLRQARDDVDRALELYADGIKNGWERDDQIIKRLVIPGWRPKTDDEIG